MFVLDACAIVVVADEWLYAPLSAVKVATTGVKQLLRFLIVLDEFPVMLDILDHLKPASNVVYIPPLLE